MAAKLAHPHAVPCVSTQVVPGAVPTYTRILAPDADKRSCKQTALERIVLDPKYHDILTLVKGVRNGVVYGCKVRFPHALV